MCIRDRGKVGAPEAPGAVRASASWAIVAVVLRDPLRGGRQVVEEVIRSSWDYQDVGLIDAVVASIRRRVAPVGTRDVRDDVSDAEVEGGQEEGRIVVVEEGRIGLRALSDVEAIPVDAGDIWLDEGELRIVPQLQLGCHLVVLS